VLPHISGEQQFVVPGGVQVRLSGGLGRAKIPQPLLTRRRGPSLSLSFSIFMIRCARTGHGRLSLRCGCGGSPRLRLGEPRNRSGSRVSHALRWSRRARPKRGTQPRPRSPLIVHDGSRAVYSSAGWSPPEPASALPADSHAAPGRPKPSTTNPPGLGNFRPAKWENFNRP
jgi:hypothetical protein